MASWLRFGNAAQPTMRLRVGTTTGAVHRARCHLMRVKRSPAQAREQVQMARSIRPTAYGNSPHDTPERRGPSSEAVERRSSKPSSSCSDGSLPAGLGTARAAASLEGKQYRPGDGQRGLYAAMRMVPVIGSTPTRLASRTRTRHPLHIPDWRLHELPYQAAGTAAG